MQKGIYRYTLKMFAPIGPRYGALELDLQSGTGGGFLTMFSKRHPISDLCCRGGRVRFSGVMETLLYPLPYTAEGTADPRSVKVVFDTEKGRFPAEGASLPTEKEETRKL